MRDILGHETTATLLEERAEAHRNAIADAEPDPIAEAAKAASVLSQVQPAREGLPPAVVAGGVLCFVMALILWAIAAVQGVSATAVPEMGIWGMLNGAVGAAYIVFGVGVLQRNKWGYDWAVVSSVLNVVFVGLQILGGAWLFVPAWFVALAIASVLYTSRDSFTA